MGLVSLYKGPQKALTLSFCHVRTQREAGSLQPRREPSPEPGGAGTLIADFQPPEM